MNYTQLTQDERYYIERRKASAITISLRQIAKEIGRSHSTISREIKRNTDPSFGFYSGLRANNLSSLRQKPPKKPAVMNTITQKFKAFIQESLQKRSSPEQICGRLKLKHALSISVTTLYRYIEADKINGGVLYKNLRHARKKYKGISKSKNIITISDKKNIQDRPAIAKLKQEPGHWEADTIFGVNQKSYLLTLTDKASKFEIIRKIPNKEAATVLVAMQEIVANTILPFKTDNGTEFAKHKDIAKLTQASFFFANAYSPWERGLNEHQNGLIRDFYPKKTDFRLVDEIQI